MIDIAIYIVLLGIIVFFGTVTAKQKRVIESKNKDIAKVIKLLAVTNERLKIKQEKLDALKQRFIAENTMVRRKN